MQKWEYCYVVGAHPTMPYGEFYTSYPTRRTFTSKPPFLIVEKFSKKPHHKEVLGLAKIIA